MARIRITLAAGMPRSASTWLYNAARLILCSQPSIARNFSGGWIGDLRSLPVKPYMLLKLHDYQPDLIAQSSCVLYSFRDIRDAMASFTRHFGRLPEFADAEHLMHQYDLWSARADYLLRYESMIQDPETEIKGIAAAMGIHNIDPARIVAEIATMDYTSPGEKTESHHQVNLFHPGHITDGRHGSWHKILPPDLEQKIVEKYRPWFEKQGYDLEADGSQ